MVPADSRKVPRAPRYSGYRRLRLASCTGLSPSVVRLSRRFHSRDFCRNTRGLGSSPFARHYWGNHSYFLFLRVLRCFSSPRWPPAKPDDIPSGYRVVPFGDPRIKGHLRLPAAFRSLSRPSSPPRAKASAMRPFLLSFIPHRSRQRSACFSFGFLTLVFLVHHVIDRTERPARRAAFRCGE